MIMTKIDEIFNYFSDRLEKEHTLTLDEIKKHKDFKKLNESEQKLLELKLRQKIESLKKERKILRDKKPKKPNKYKDKDKKVKKKDKK